MSFFAVTLEKIESARPHPNADRLDLCTLAGSTYQFVTGRNEFSAGDSVVYIPLDSVLPPNLIETLGLTGKLAGSEANRVKTVTLRGEISQGLAIPPAKLLQPGDDQLSPEALTAKLGITKYNPEPNDTKDAILLPLPHGTSMYDIESTDRFADVAQTLMNEEVIVSEKIEGNNFSITLNPEGQIFVNCRENTIIEKPGVPNKFWDTSRSLDLISKIQAIYQEIQTQEWGEGHRNSPITLFGEITGEGIKAGGKSNYYQLPNTTLYFFDLRSAKGFFPALTFLEVAQRHGLTPVPTLTSGNQTLAQWLNGKSLREAANGKSLINPSKRREGIVIKPLQEGRFSRGRLILKQHSPEYLAKAS
jgi:RNA ligase (TIGR02306 family)